jgi:hypothetical protein
VTDILRSKKYRQLSDKEIIRLHSQEPKGEAKYFLEIEIDIRQLGNTVALSKEQRLKRNRHSLWYYLFYALMLMLALGRYGGKF